MSGFARRQALGLLASTSLLAAAPAVAKGKGGPLYKDAAAPIDLRVRDLLARMTLEEKVGQIIALWATKADVMDDLTRSEEHTSELQSLMRTSYAVFCLKKKK